MMRVLTESGFGAPVDVIVEDEEKFERLKEDPYLIYHAQQAVEKALKAAFIHIGIEIPKVHGISRFEGLDVRLTASGGEITLQEYDDKVLEAFRQAGREVREERDLFS